MKLCDQREMSAKVLIRKPKVKEVKEVKEEEETNHVCACKSTQIFIEF